MFDQDYSLPLRRELRGGAPVDQPCGWCPGCNTGRWCEQPGVCPVDMKAVEAALPAGWTLVLPAYLGEADDPAVHVLARDLAGCTHTVGGGFLDRDTAPRELALALCDVRRCGALSCEALLLDHENQCQYCGTFTPPRRAAYRFELDANTAARWQAATLIPGAAQAFHSEVVVLPGRGEDLEVLETTCGEQHVRLALYLSHPGSTAVVTGVIVTKRVCITPITGRQVVRETRSHSFLRGLEFQLPCRIELRGGYLDIAVRSR